MKDDLKKVKGLTYNRELADRVGVAMFMYARNLDLSGEETYETRLARWILQNPMAVDQTMLALVATDPEVLAASTVAVEVTEEPTETGRRANTQKEPSTYTPAAVTIEGVTDELIVGLVEENWTKVATKSVSPAISSTVDEVIVTNGTPINPFLELDSPPMPDPTTSDKPARE